MKINRTQDFFFFKKAVKYILFKQKLIHRNNMAI